MSASLPDLLLLAPCLPSPAARGKGVRWFHLLRFLGQRYRVHLGCFVERADDSAYFGRVKALCYETCFVERPRGAAHRRSLQLMTGREAQAVAACRNEELARWIARLHRRHQLHAALACSAPMALHLESLAGVRRLADFVALDSQLRRHSAAERRWPMAAMWRREAGLLWRHERSLALACDHVSFASDAHADLLRALAPQAGHKVMVLPDAVDADHFSPHILQRKPYPQGIRAILWANGVDDALQVNAAHWFAKEVLASLRANDPGVRLYITGSPGAAAAHALERHDGVVMAGPAHELRPWLAHAALAVAPQAAAPGAASHVLEALAMQKPLVAAPAALDGLKLAAGAEALVASGAAEFKGHIEWALSNAGARDMARAARARVAREHQWPASFAALAACLDGTPCARAGAA